MQLFYIILLFLRFYVFTFPFEFWINWIIVNFEWFTVRCCYCYIQFVFSWDWDAGISWLIIEYCGEKKIKNQMKQCVLCVRLQFLVRGGEARRYFSIFVFDSLEEKLTVFFTISYNVSQWFPLTCTSMKTVSVFWILNLKKKCERCEYVLRRDIIYRENKNHHKLTEFNRDGAIEINIIWIEIDLKNGQCISNVNVNCFVGKFTNRVSKIMLCGILDINCWIVCNWFCFLNSDRYVR